MDDASDLELGAIYRALARRCHPDLAKSEDDRRRHEVLMQRINKANSARDLQTLRDIARELEGKPPQPQPSKTTPPPKPPPPAPPPPPTPTPEAERKTEQAPPRTQDAPSNAPSRTTNPLLTYNVAFSACFLLGFVVIIVQLIGTMTLLHHHRSTHQAIGEGILSTVVLTIFSVVTGIIPSIGQVTYHHLSKHMINIFSFDEIDHGLFRFVYVAGFIVNIIFSFVVNFLFAYRQRKVRSEDLSISWWKTLRTILVVLLIYASLELFISFIW